MKESVQHCSNEFGARGTLFPCNRKATVWRDGVPYCMACDPVRLAARLERERAYAEQYRKDGRRKAYDKRRRQMALESKGQ